MYHGRNQNVVFYFDDPLSNRKKLFEDALSFAKEGKVLYILPEELNELPDLSQELTLVSKQYMKMISFLYAKTLESLIVSLSSLPDWQNVPSLIILDDLYNYSKSNTQIACGLVAFLLDSAISCSHTQIGSCFLYISVTKETFGEENCKMLREMYAM